MGGKVCSFKENKQEQCTINLLYQGTIHFKVLKYGQEQTGVLRYEGLVEKAKNHERTCLEYKTHSTSHGKCSKRNVWDQCLAFNQSCNKCSIMNYFYAQCHSSGLSKEQNSYKKGCSRQQTAATTRMCTYCFSLPQGAIVEVVASQIRKAEAEQQAIS